MPKKGRERSSEDRYRKGVVVKHKHHILSDPWKAGYISTLHGLGKTKSQPDPKRKRISTGEKESYASRPHSGRKSAPTKRK